MNDRAPSIEPSAPRSPSVTCSGQVLPRHTGGAPYRCSLPGLAGFDASRCVGPNLQRRPVRLIQHKRPSRREFNPAIADCGLQGTATSPSSTAKASGGDKGICRRVALRQSRLGAPRRCTPSTPSHRHIARGWRRGWDSNPRYSCPYTAFPVPHLRPLGHPSPPAAEKAAGASLKTAGLPIPQIWRRGEDLNPRGTCAPIRFRVGRLQPGSATPPRQS